MVNFEDGFMALQIYGQIGSTFVMTIYRINDNVYGELVTLKAWKGQERYKPLPEPMLTQTHIYGSSGDGVTGNIKMRMIVADTPWYWNKTWKVFIYKFWILQSIPEQSHPL